MSTKIFQVDHVKLIRLKSYPPRLLVHAIGTLSTEGWDNPELRLVEIAPIEGMYQFDFCATSPSGEVPQILRSITATYVFTEIPEDFMGVIVNASSNSIEQKEGANDQEENLISRFTSPLETLKGIQIADGKLKIRVATNGCTSKDSFIVDVERIGFTGATENVGFYRVKQDYCKGYFPEGIDLEYSLDELEIEPYPDFKVLNRIGIKP